MGDRFGGKEELEKVEFILTNNPEVFYLFLHLVVAVDHLILIVFPLPRDSELLMNLRAKVI